MEKPEQQPTLNDLLRKYSIGDIPDSELRQIGYVKMKLPDGGYRITTKDAIEKEQQKKKESKEQKTREAPFEELELSLTKSRSFLVSGERVEKAKRIIEGVEEIIKDSLSDRTKDKFILKESCIRKFWEGFQDFLIQNGANEYEEYWAIEELFFYQQFQAFGDFDDLEKVGQNIGHALFPSFNYEEERDEEDNEENNEEMKKREEENRASLEQLEKYRSVLTDRDLINERFLEGIKDEANFARALFLAQSEPLEGKDWDHPQDKLEELVKAKGDSPDFLATISRNPEIKTFEDFYSLGMKVFFEHADFIELSKKLSKKMTIEELRLLFSKNLTELTPSYARRKELEAKMKTASLDEKRELSKELKELKTQTKKETEILLGFATLLSPWQVTTPYFDREFNKAIGLLSKGKKGEKETFYMNGRPDKELDKDPGQISGDCTAGKPLPFEDPLIPVYNIKFLNSERNHIGNIYLLRTTTSGDKDEKVYHLEAIQIPYSLNWHEAIKEIISEIAKEAMSRGIGLITVNAEEGLISNYPAIEREVRKYAQEQGLGIEYIEIPTEKFDSSEKNSWFQGDGDALILWKNISSRTV